MWDTGHIRDLEARSSLGPGWLGAGHGGRGIKAFPITGQDTGQQRGLGVLAQLCRVTQVIPLPWDPRPALAADVLDPVLQPLLLLGLPVVKVVLLQVCFPGQQCCLLHLLQLVLCKQRQHQEPCPPRAPTTHRHPKPGTPRGSLSFGVALAWVPQKTLKTSSCRWLSRASGGGAGGRL